MRRDPLTVGLAQARTALRTGEAARSRTAARRGLSAGPSTAADPRLVIVAADPARTDRVTSRAAAAALSGRIAGAVTRAARADIVAAMGAEARTFALEVRHSMPGGFGVARGSVAEDWALARAKVQALLDAVRTGAIAHPSDGDLPEALRHGLRLALAAEPDLPTGPREDGASEDRNAAPADGAAA